MDKQMIEEMAKKYPITEQDKLFNIVNSACDLIYMRKDNIEKIVKAVRNAGYRKIPENAVIVTKSVWEEHIELRERAMRVFEERIRKETAEKFAERLKERFNPYYTEGLSEAIDKIAKEITEGE